MMEGCVDDGILSDGQTGDIIVINATDRDQSINRAVTAMTALKQKKLSQKLAATLSLMHGQRQRWPIHGSRFWAITSETNELTTVKHLRVTHRLG